MASTQDVLQTFGHEQPLTISAPTVPPRVPNLHDRQYWEKRILHNGHQKLTVSKIIDSLGLKRKGGTGAKKGSPVFFNKNVRRLADGVISITDKMPKDLAGVLDYAVSPEKLSSEVARVLRLLGNEIWGAHRERSWLLQASDGLEDYPRDLDYGNEHDRATIKEYVRQWIIINATGTAQYYRYKKSNTSKPAKEMTSRIPKGSLEHDPAAYDEAYWTRRLNGTNTLPSIRSVVESLGLGSQIVFQEEILDRLNGAISVIASDLTRSQVNLIDIAVAPEKLHNDVDKILLRFGDEIWSGGDKEEGEISDEGLVYSRAEDRIKIRNYVRLWILFKAFNAHVYSNIKSQDPSDGAIETAKQSPTMMGDKYEVEELTEGTWAASKFAPQMSKARDDPHVAAQSPESSIAFMTNGEATPVPEQAEVVGYSLDMYGSNSNIAQSTTAPEIYDTPISGHSSSHEALGALATSAKSTSAVEVHTEPSSVVDHSPSLPQTRMQDRTVEVSMSGLANEAAVNLLVPAVELRNVGTRDPVVPSTSSPEVATTKVTSPPDMVAADVEHTKEAANVSDVPTHPWDKRVARSEKQISPRVSLVPGGKIRGPSGTFLPKTTANMAAVGVNPGTSRAARSTRKPIVTYNEAILSGRAIHTPTKYLETHHKNVMHGPMDSVSAGPASPPSAVNGNQPPIRGVLDMMQNWNEATWRLFVTTPPVKREDFITSLGFKTIRTGNGCVIDHPVGSQLMIEVNRLSNRLYAQLQGNQLVTAAAVPDFLDDETSILLQAFSPQYWAEHADRSQMLKANEVELYPKDLVYEWEDEDDHKLLQVHLHQWIFAKAFGNVRKHGDNDAARARITGVLEQQNSSAAAYKMPHKDYASAASLVTKMQEEADVTPAAEQECATVEEDLPLRTRTRQGQLMAMNAGKRESTTPYGTPSHEQKSKKQKLAHTHSATGETLTTALLGYLTNDDLSTALERSLLDPIEAELTRISPDLPTLLGAASFSSAFPIVFTAWIAYRRTILSVRQRQPMLLDTKLNANKIKIQRSRLLTELRIAHDIFAATEDDSGLAPQSIICMAFKGLQDSKKKAEQIRWEIRVGFEKMDRKLLELGDELGSGKWIFGT